MHKRAKPVRDDAENSMLGHYTRALKRLQQTGCYGAPTASEKSQPQLVRSAPTSPVVTASEKQRRLKRFLRVIDGGRK